MARDAAKPIVLREQAIGGAVEGAEQMERETARWVPSMRSPDQIINPIKDLGDARGRDMVLNDGYASGAAALHRDNIIGSQYRLNAQPNWVALGLSQSVGEAWSNDFQRIAEARFTILAESEACYLDAQRRLTFTGLCRLVSNGYVMSGEALAVAEWIRDADRPLKTAIQLISPTRLSNPNGVMDNRLLRRGIERDLRGRPVAAHIRNAYPTEVEDPDSYRWKRVAWNKPWGRSQVIHIMDPLLVDQSRGISDMVAVLKQMRMTKKFQEVTLQNAVINASFAAAIESELPSPEVFAQLGAGGGALGAQAAINGFRDYLGAYMGDMGSYLTSARNISLDGAKIPHLFPGTKLNLKPAGDPGGMGSNFEQSLLRHIASALGLSYEQFSRDYTSTNYSSARASMNETWKSMMAKKTAVVDRFANQVYQLYVEEDIANGNLPLPPGKTRDWFYEPLVKDAICQATWIGAARGQIDEVKETNAALMRINGCLSTLEIECSKQGLDWRQVLAQKAREKKALEEYGLTMADVAAASNANPAPDPQQDEEDEDEL